jgi:hypothetical protein
LLACARLGKGVAPSGFSDAQINCGRNAVAFPSMNQGSKAVDPIVAIDDFRRIFSDAY